eukprot:TRINITY_DN1984_c1_g2_i1.p1 TRINITY_DN1984_c1_g2~~TRINITY_DN1984_c1_g2_i1.p1  ORF type:complete len:240 (+),score=65.69 TRINITY_DN1984_c1_g2_i1:168-887(+)
MDTKKELIEKSKKMAAIKVVDENVKDGMILGIGSGSTIVYVVERLKERVQKEKLNIICLSTSYQSKMLIFDSKLQYADLDQYPEIDLTIDGADEFDKEFNLIKGGGGCHLQEKLLAVNSKKLIIVADYTKQSVHLGEKWKQGVPIEVLPRAILPVTNALTKLGGKVNLRIAVKKAGPIITDNGGVILDAYFGNIEDPLSLDNKIQKIVGVLETGLFINCTNTIYLGKENGEVEVLIKKK